MALFRKFFYRKPPDGLLEISERVYGMLLSPDLLISSNASFLTMLHNRVDLFGHPDNSLCDLSVTCDS